MDKKEIARKLEEIGALLEIRGENPFKVRAYTNAARTLEGLSADLGELIAKGKLTEVRGIGKNLAEHITELFRTGHLKEYEKIMRGMPPGLLEMLEIPGVGPRKVKTLWEKLKITTMEKLERAVLQGKLAMLEGFGEKTARKIFEGIQMVKKHAGRFLYPVALEAAEIVVNTLKKHPKVKRIAVAGSLRRCKETVKDIDLVASSGDPEAVMKAFVSLEAVDKIVQHGETKSAVLLKRGIQADLRCVGDAEFFHALQHFTGSKEHNIRLRALAQEKGMKLNEYGLFRGKKKILCADEAAIYAKLGLHLVPPELREGGDEIELAAKGTLPRLIETGDIQGVFHCHTTYSDGTATVEEMALGAKALKFRYFGFADHSESAHYAGGLDLGRIKKQFKEIEAAAKKIPGLRLFRGLEADILPDGSMDMGDKVLGLFDYVVASVHSHFKMTEKEMTERILKAARNKHVRILGHMTGRLLLSREGYAVDSRKVIEACADHGVAIELNANPFRLDIDWRQIPYAKQRGAMIVINPDAHSVEGISHFRYGVGIARKGGLMRADVLNTRGVKEVEKWLATRK